MPNTGKRAEPPTEEERARIVSGPDPDRFYCPHSGCNRSFAELWRLKVHFRAPPDVRGSGKERGHGTELKFCPKCGKDLRPGKHHVGCSAGKSAPRQAAKRQRQQQMSTTTESPQPAATTTEQTSGSWEQAVRRQAVKQRQTSEAESKQRIRKVEACRIETLVQNLDAHHAGGLLFHSNVHHHSTPTPAGGGSEATMAPQQFFQQQQPQHPQQQPGGGADGGASQQHQGQPAQLPHLELPQHGDASQLRTHSPSPLDLFSDPFGAVSHANGQLDPFGHEEDDLLRIPSPPPLPADWDVAPRAGMLFDFDQFDASKKHLTGTSAPLVTVTTSMNPVDVLNPSDDYIWQILFAGENDAVPKRVTAHLHHPPATSLSYLDESDPLLDAILSSDLGPSPLPSDVPDVPLLQHERRDADRQQAAQQQQQAAQQQQAQLPEAAHQQHAHQQQHEQQAPQQQAHELQLGAGVRLDPSAERLVPVGNGQYQHAQQHQQMHASLGVAAYQHHPAQRNGFGGSHGPADLAPPAVKLEGGSFSFL